LLKFPEVHEWLKLDDGIATVDITEHVATTPDDLVFIQLPAVGGQLAKGAGAALVESVKAASGVFAPLAGEVVEVTERFGPSIPASR
jgi:glycine cleavage system H protein